VCSENWLTALKVRMDKNILAKSSYSLTSSQINQSEFDKFAEFFQKQMKIYEAISEADHSDTITASGIAVAQPVEMVKYIESELASMGLGSYLTKVLQEFMVLPVDAAFAEEYWDTLVMVCQEMRELKRRHGYLDDDMKSSLLTTERCIRLFEKKEKSTGGKAVMEMNRLKLQVFTKVCIISFSIGIIFVGINICTNLYYMRVRMKKLSDCRVNLRQLKLAV
jgi:hypothetical protein